MSSSAREVLFGRPPGIGLLMKWITCAFIGGLPDGRRRMPASASARSPSAFAHRCARRCARKPMPIMPSFAALDRRRVGRVEEQHRRRDARCSAARLRCGAGVAHRDRHVAEIDVDRARVHALVADRAVVGDVAELVEVPERDAAARLLLVEERLGQQAASRGSCCAGCRAGSRAARASRTPACTCRSAGSP